ncbi:MAG: hypothetical protein AAFX90_20755, partial [Pseudomonadota bacterium]
PSGLISELTWRAALPFAISKHMPVSRAALVGIEPRLTDAAMCTNVRSLNTGQKRDKIKGSFAKGL